MFKVSASLEHACLQSPMKKFWTALATGFWWRSFQIISILVEARQLFMAWWLKTVKTWL